MQENNQTNNPNGEPEASAGPTPNPVVISNPVVTATDMVGESTTAAYDTVLSTETVMVETPVVVSESVDTMVTAETAVPALALGKNRQVLVQYGIATLVVLVMGAGLTYALEQQGRINTGVFEKINALINPVPSLW